MKFGKQILVPRERLFRGMKSSNNETEWGKSKSKNSRFKKIDFIEKSVLKYVSSSVILKLFVYTFFLDHNSNDHFFSLPKYLQFSYITFGKSIGMMILAFIIDIKTWLLFVSSMFTCLSVYVFTCVLLDYNPYKIRSS